MAVFVTSLIVFIASVITFLILLTLWVSTDAKSRENTNPQLWGAITFFCCCPIGVLIYFMARGRLKRDYEYNRFTYRVLTSLFVVCLALFFLYIGSLSLTVASQEEGFFRREGRFFGFTQTVVEQGWEISTTRSDGHIRNNFYLKQEDLNNLFTNIQIGEGEVILVLRQLSNNNSERFNISNQPITTIDVTQIEPGMIRKYVIFREATDINLSISWAVNNHRE